MNENPGTDFFAGWIDPEPLYKTSESTLEAFRHSYFIPRKVEVSNVPCADPDWMKSDTYYPPGTICYKDPTEGSCFRFGNSGSSVMTNFKDEGGTDRYAFAGPLSMHKGCDQV